MVRQTLVVCVMAPPIHLGAWSLMLWLPIMHTSVHTTTVRGVCVLY